MYKVIFYTHLISVNLFLVAYLYKTFLLLMNKNEQLAKFTKATKVPEMIISTAFLASGIYMLIEIPEIKLMLIIKIVAVFASIPLAVIGFKKGKKVLAVLAIILIIAAYGLAEMSKKQKSAGTRDEQIEGNSMSPEAVYTANCAKCHGDDGKLGLMGASDLTTSTMEPNVKIETIKHGKGAMTPFEGLLSDEQIGAVVGYIETLKK